ncbi:MAG: oxygenase MpaB family protein [Myxococcales bacterium]|nr:oxygenase MpaB family protein [Myxococcales bacterium]
MATGTQVNLDEVQFCLDRAHRVSWRSQRPDGSWDCPGQVGAWVTAQVVTVLRYLDVLDAADTAAAAKWLTSQQRPDGSFAIHAYSKHGDLGSTAAGWAALHACGAAAAASKAKQWVEANGGVAAVSSRVNEGDLSALFLGMAGLVDPQHLPCPSTAALLVPPVRKALETRFHSGVFMMAFEFELLVKKLRGDFGPDGTRKTLLDSLKCRGAIDVLKTFQNDNGSWNDSAVISVLALPCLDAIGSPESRSMLARALAWVNSQKVKDERGLRFDGFGTEVWSTAFNTRALLAGGVPPNDADLARALEWMAKAQLTTPMPKVDNRQADAVLVGGWAFQRTNHTMPDADDAGVVLTAFGMAMAAKHRAMLSQDTFARLQRSSQLGMQWVFSMQNPDGGWSAFVWGLPGKAAGPVMEQNPHVDMSNLLDLLESVVDVPPPMGDPSTEDLTSRVLHGLGHLGLTQSHPAVEKGVQFLKAQQATNGAWWGRWVVNYLSATAFVLMGLAAVKVDVTQPWVRRGVAFLLRRQNADGGWGEGPESYVSMGQAGRGPSMAPLSGLVVQALIDVGEGDSDAVTRGLQYLLSNQAPDGTWSNGEYLHTNVPPDTFYVYPEAARFYPTEALGKYLAWKQQPSTAVTPRTRWSDAQLDAARLQMDPLADDVITDIVAKHSVAEVNAVMSAIFRTDQPIPPGMPALATEYFEQHVTLPDWADEAQLQLAQRLFTRAGWQIATCLFCSSLPQAYAAAKGARVIAATQAMTKHTRQRIFETAQFLFDSVSEGAFAPTGRGALTVLKVRLMHAAVRHFLKERATPTWDTAFFGEPLNQEDMAGTLMTFSVVVLDGLEKLGVQVSLEEQQAWLHAWKVVGHFMGVVPDMLPTDLDDAHELMEAIRDRQWRTSTDGAALTKALIEMMQQYFPGDAFDGFPVALVRLLAGDHCADLLGLPPADWTKHVIDVVAELETWLTAGDPTVVSRRLLDSASFAVMRMVVTVERDGKQAQFRIPPSLQQTIDPTR